MWGAKKHLEAHHIVFQPGVNEDLAATAVWGTQQVGMFPGAKYDGVFGMWYGKGPGVDRCGDVFKHANAAGTSKHGGVLALAGDDHAAKSSTLPHQSDHIFKACMIPVFYPANVQEYPRPRAARLRHEPLRRLLGRASRRHRRGRVAAPRSRSTRSGSGSGCRATSRCRRAGSTSAGPTASLEQEARLLDYKVYAALAYVRANRLDRIVVDWPERAPRHRHHRQVLRRHACRRWPTSASTSASRATSACACTRSAMTWPLEPQGARDFAEGLEEILVVEEKRQLIEYQIKEELYNWRDGVRGRAWSASSTTTASGAAPPASPPARGCCRRTTSTRRRWSRA